jgi:hypothetical protein
VATTHGGHTAQIAASCKPTLNKWHIISALEIGGETRLVEKEGAAAAIMR